MHLQAVLQQKAVQAYRTRVHVCFFFFFFPPDFAQKIWILLSFSFQQLNLRFNGNYMLHY